MKKYSIVVVYPKGTVNCCSEIVEDPKLLFDKRRWNDEVKIVEILEEEQQTIYRRRPFNLCKFIFEWSIENNQWTEVIDGEERLFDEIPIWKYGP